MQPRFYRYQTLAYTTEGIAQSTVKVVEEKYVGVRETPCGWWIIHYSDYHGKMTKEELKKDPFKKWVGKWAKKRFAYPTKEEAMKNFRLRTEKYVRILTYRIDNAKRSLKIAEGDENCRLKRRKL